MENLYVDDDLILDIADKAASKLYEIDKSFEEGTVSLQGVAEQVVYLSLDYMNRKTLPAVLVYTMADIVRDYVVWVIGRRESDPGTASSIKVGDVTTSFATSKYVNGANSYNAHNWTVLDDVLLGYKKILNRHRKMW